MGGVERRFCWCCLQDIALEFYFFFLLLLLADVWLQAHRRLMAALAREKLRRTSANRKKEIISERSAGREIRLVISIMLRGYRLLADGRVE